MRPSACRSWLTIRDHRPQRAHASHRQATEGVGVVEAPAARSSTTTRPDERGIITKANLIVARRTTPPASPERREAAKDSSPASRSTRLLNMVEMALPRLRSCLGWPRIRCPAPCRLRFGSRPQWRNLSTLERDGRRPSPPVLIRHGRQVRVLGLGNEILADDALASWPGELARLFPPADVEVVESSQSGLHLLATSRALTAWW